MTTEAQEDVVDTPEDASPPEEASPKLEEEEEEQQDTLHPAPPSSLQRRRSSQNNTVRFSATGLLSLGTTTTNTTGNNNNNNAHRSSRAGLSSSARSSSMDMRKLPVDDALLKMLSQSNSQGGLVLDIHHPSSQLMLGETSSTSSLGGEDDDSDSPSNKKKQTSPKGGGDAAAEGSSTPAKEDGSIWSRMVHATCLSPKLSFQSQLLYAFGSIHGITIVVVVAICIAVAVTVGHSVESQNRAEFQALIEQDVQTARYLADALTHRLLPLDLTRILVEAVQDRFAAPATTIPYTDVWTNESVYPLVGPAVPWDWETPAAGQLVTADNYQTHMSAPQWNLYQYYSQVSTASAFFHIQGTCNPDARDPETDIGYWPNCSASINNNLNTGGAVAPSSDTAAIYESAKDLVPLLKAIFEVQPDVRNLGIFFANQGAGASLNFPHYPITGDYTSIGCDWLTESPNPYNASTTIGTADQVAKCHPEGTRVPSRAYNPLERGWCRDQAQNPQKVLANVVQDAWNPGQYVLTTGQGIYLSSNHQFLGCTWVALSLETLNEVVTSAKVTPNSHLSILLFNQEGTVVSTSMKDTTDLNQDESRTIAQLSIGLTQESYQELYSLVDFSGSWDPAKARETYENFKSKNDGFIVSAFPVPPIPVTFEASYVPEFLVVVSTSEQDVFQVVGEVEDDIDNRVRVVTIFSIIAGAVGLVVGFLILAVMARALTRPLHYMNQSADEIINDFGQVEDPLAEEEAKATKESEKQNQDSADKDPKGKANKCSLSPRTELNEVVQEFDKMVASFSGSLSSKSGKSGESMEFPNTFWMRKTFVDLYKSRDQESFKYKVEPTKNVELEPQPESNLASVDDSTSSPFSFIHPGKNFYSNASNSTTVTSAQYRAAQGSRGWSSPLFLWTAVLIVTPLIITTVTITAVVMVIVSNEFGSSLNSAEKLFLDVQLRTQQVHANLRASYVNGLTSDSVRDLQILTRYANWLTFGGVAVADSYTFMTSPVEDCKTYSEDGTDCPWVQVNDICDCAWNDPRNLECTEFPNGSRQLQQVAFLIEANDVLSNGDRPITSFPNVSYSAASTAWFDGVENVPGATGPTMAQPSYQITQGRLQMTGANAILMVLYNYAKPLKSTLSLYIAFEADGGFVGYAGCAQQETPAFAYWKSTIENDASILRPELCPIDKYGYDPRCRGWYEGGRQLALRGEGNLYVTSPYLFAATEARFGQSATSPLVDPATGEHVGQVLLDFVNQPVFDALNPSSTVLHPDAFPVLIAAQVEANDTIVGPGYDPRSATAYPLASFVLPNDVDCDSSKCMDNLAAFQAIVTNMKKGESATASFDRTGEAGGTERMYISYAPVEASSVRAEDASDFAQGFTRGTYLVYSLALVSPESAILEGFASIEDDTNNAVNIAVGVIAAVIFVACLLVVFLSYHITLSTTTPMLYLRDMIRNINKMDLQEEPPEMDLTVGSKEIANVATTMETLYKVVRSANAAYSAGDLGVAHDILIDSLRLFKRLDNKKAIGVAANNLGNTLFAMYLDIKNSGAENRYGMTKQEIVAKAFAYFHLSIQQGEALYDEFYDSEGWTPRCLDFMQHLSNRYFNRGMFLMCAKDDFDNEAPEDKMEELGRRDLQISFDMDVEVVAYGEDIGWNASDRVVKLFAVSMVRARGYNLLLGLGFAMEESWEVQERLDEAFGTVRSELAQDVSELFQSTSPAGRMQEVETELMKFFMIQGDVLTAAQIGIRLLFEDGYAGVGALTEALTVLIAHVQSPAFTLEVDKNDDKDHHHHQRMRLVRDLEELIYLVQSEVDRLHDEQEQSAHHHSSTAVQRSMKKSSLYTTSLTSSSVQSSSVGSRWLMREASGKFVTMEDF